MKVDYDFCFECLESSWFQSTMMNRENKHVWTCSAGVGDAVQLQDGDDVPSVCVCKLQYAMAVTLKGKSVDKG